jgi:hypothetical protein
MPSRILRDGYISSERLSVLDDSTWRFYMSLIAIVDDYGCAEWNPATIRGKLYPYDDPPKSTVEIRGLMDGCLKGDRPLIVTYNVNGKDYLQIQQFDQRKQSKPKYPLPESTVDHGEKPLHATRARSESGIRSRVSESKTLADPPPPSPTMPRRPRQPDFQPFEPDEPADAVTRTAEELCRMHAAAGMRAGEVATAAAAIARWCRNAVHPEKILAAMRDAHPRYVAVDWHPRMARNPGGSLPTVAQWLATDEWKHPPAAVAIAPAKPARKLTNMEQWELESAEREAREATK